MGQKLPAILPLTSAPEAFAPLAEKINELVAAYNAMRPEGGPGIKITTTDAGARFEVSGLTATGECSEEEAGKVDITIYAEE